MPLFLKSRAEARTEFSRRGSFLNVLKLEVKVSDVQSSSLEHLSTIRGAVLARRHPYAACSLKGPLPPFTGDLATS
jgi:hypothetical protein